jgi:hypothetical protein
MTNTKVRSICYEPPLTPALSLPGGERVSAGWVRGICVRLKANQYKSE